MDKISSISKSFSSQPNYYWATDEEDYKEIKRELITIGEPSNGEDLWMYVDYSLAD